MKNTKKFMKEQLLPRDLEPFINIQRSEYVTTVRERCASPLRTWHSIPRLFYVIERLF
jgi:hypothetical protein